MAKSNVPTLGPCTCKRGQQRDNCPQCEGTGQRIDFAAIRARNAAARAQEHEEVIAKYDEDTYDTDAMRTDADNGNFSPDRAEEYRHTEIVAASIVNGQLSQARQQCSRYGLIYEEQMSANGRDPWK